MNRKIKIRGLRFTLALMKHQFYLVYNPNAPDDPRYVYHAKAPRFFAEIKGDELQLHEMIDIDPERVESKLKRMRDWYKHYLFNNK